MRWIVAGAFSAAPSGRRMRLNAADLSEALEAAKVTANAVVTDRLGADATRSFEVSFPTFKSFQTSEVVESVRVLRELQGLGAALAHTDPTRRPTPDAALAKVIDLVGDGKLAASLRAKLGLAKAPADPSPAAPAKTSEPAASGGLSVDEILTSAPNPVAAPSASSVIGSFVKAVRDPGAATTAPSAGRAARDVIEAEVFATAVDILNESTVATLESAWRGIKLLVDACPTGAGMAVDVLDVASDKAMEVVLADLAETELDELPDAIFVNEPVDDIDALGAWAGLGADHDVPVVAWVTHRFFNVAEPGQVAAKVDAENAGLPSAWAALRADEASRWLTVVSNRVVLRQEGTGVARRVVFGSPVMALGAMLAGSFHRTGAFAQVVGENVSIPSPGSWELPSGRDAGMLVPTEAFYSAATQGLLAQAGILGFGSRRNSANLVLKSVPTVRGGDDLVPLSAQILTGRIVRFARWVLAQLPPNCPEAEVKLLFEQAAAVFLFPTAAEAAKLEAQVVTPKEGSVRNVVLQVSVHPVLAGIMFNLAFSLPLAD